jgi:hypothetical protein
MARAGDPPSPEATVDGSAFARATVDKKIDTRAIFSGWKLRVLYEIDF